MKITPNHKKGIILALFTAIISGFSIFYNKLIIVKSIDPLIFNILKNGGVALIITSTLLFSRQLPKLKQLTSKQWRKLFLIAIIGGSLPFILFFEGLRLIPAVNANLIHKTLFIWVAAMAMPFLGEKLNIWQVMGYLIVVWSNLFIGGLSGFTGHIGELMVLAATLLWSLENIIAKIALKEIDSQIVAWSRMFFGTIVLLAIAIFQNKIFLLVQITPSQLQASFGSIIFLSLYVLSWYKALQLAPATLVSSILILATPITNVLTAVFVTHNFPQIQFINSLFIPLGVLLIIYFAPNLSKKKIAASST